VVGAAVGAAVDAARGGGAGPGGVEERRGRGGALARRPSGPAAAGQAHRDVAAVVLGGGVQAGRARRADRRRHQRGAWRSEGQGRAGDELDAELARLDVGPDHPVHAVAVGDPDGAQPEAMRGLDQLVGMAGALEEREARLAPQRDVGRIGHGEI
jgi:hypothetical protein